jgi:hypothetical protein
MKNQRERGNTIIEFTLVAAFVLVPMFLFTYAIGFNLLQQLEVVQFTRDAGHLFVTVPVDLNSNDFKSILNQVGGTVGFTTTGTSTAEVIFAKVVFVDTGYCNAGGGTCSNKNNWVYAQYFTLGTAPSGFTPLLAAPSGVTANDDQGTFKITDQVNNPALKIGTTLPSTLSAIQAYNATADTGLPSGQWSDVVQVAATPFNVPAVVNIPALTDYASF